MCAGGLNILRRLYKTLIEQKMYV